MDTQTKVKQKKKEQKQKKMKQSQPSKRSRSSLQSLLMKRQILYPQQKQQQDADQQNIFISQPQ
ncbi:hypothetical protein DPMN_044809 [Dreissena polymorpha]|uniref:Uncharacterized protein n=1 Tax=Dreissena polymorpha TaxID=45954 RepID=A0A9D4D2X3_DREPO|nr:hypothetical protein DPMN_044809 [Dreissena polymorpha]